MERFFPPRVDEAPSRVEAGPTAEGLDATIKKKPKDDPIGSFLLHFVKTLDVEHAVTGEIDFSYLSPAQKAESMWAVFNNVMRTARKLKWKQPEEKVNKDELNELRIGLGAIKNLYEDEEVKKVFKENYRRHLQEKEAINGDLEKFKALKKKISGGEKLLDDYARRIFGKRRSANEIDRMLFKTAKNNLSESRSAMSELLESSAELRVLNQFEEIKDYAGQLKNEGYMWSPSRRKFLEEFEEAALFGKPLLVFGESGTGKTELIKAASVRLTGEIATETGGRNVRLQDLIAKREIIGDKTLYKFGDLGRAATGKSTTLDVERIDDGRIVIDDEFNLLDQAEQIDRLAKIASWKQGKKTMLPVITEEVEIAPNFLYCASINLASEKYTGGRKDIPLEVMRKFGKQLEVSFLSREEIFDAMQAALMDENGRMRAAKSEISPAYDEKEESRVVQKEGQEVRQTIRRREIKEQEEKNGKMIMVGGFIWRLSGVIDQLNKSMSRQETVLKSKGEAQYLNKVLIDIGKIVGLMENYVLSEDKISLERFVVKYVREQFSEMKSFSREDRELTKEFFAHFNIDLNSDMEKPTVDFEIMTPRDIGLLSPRIRYEKIVSEEPVLTEAVFVDAEGRRVEYRIQPIKKGDKKFIPGQIFKMSGRNYEFLGVDKANGDPVYAPYKVKPKVESRKESVAPAIINVEWRNPETGQEQRIEIALENNLEEQKKFYLNRLNLEMDEREVRSIWNKNYTEIKNEIEKYGYDSIFIVPDNLPEEEILNRDLVETMEETVSGKKKKVAKTLQGDNFTKGGSFAGVKNSYAPKYRLVLTHSIQNIEDHPILKAMRSKNVMQVTGLDMAEVNRRIANGEELPVDCKLNINGQEIEIKAEGESLEEYELQQRMYFEKTGHHLDEKSNSYARLLKSYSGSRVVDAFWYPGDRRLSVFARVPGYANGLLGLRLSRSFSN